MIKSISNIKTLDFDLPPELEASEPPEARGLARDEVRLMVSYRADNQVVHTQFRNIGDFLEPGDLLVINTSGTMNAAIYAQRADGTALELHLSTPLPHRYVFPPAYRSVGFARHTLPPPGSSVDHAQEKEVCRTCNQPLLENADDICASCGQPRYRVTKHFQDFLKKYFPYIDQFPKEKKTLYQVRSQLAHGMDLLQADLEPWKFLFDAKVQEQNNLQRNLYFIVGIAIYNWLHTVPSATGVVT